MAVRRTGNEASGAAAAAGDHDGARVAGRRRSRALQRPRCTYLRLRRRRPSSAGGVKWPISGWAYSRRRYPNRRFLSSGHPMSRRSTSKPGAGSARIGPAGAPPPESQYDRRPAFRSPNFRTREERFGPAELLSGAPDTAEPPPCAPPTANRDEPSGGIISVATPDSAPPLVPLQSEHERLLQHRPAITTLNHPLARRHGPTAAHARAVPHHPPIPRRASRDMPTTRAPAGPRRRRAARGGGRAMHLTPSPTAEITAATP